jgi:hypothetical protein
MNFTKYTAALALLAATSVYADGNGANDEPVIAVKPLDFNIYNTAVTKCKESQGQSEEKFNICMKDVLHEYPTCPIIKLADAEGFNQDAYDKLMVIEDNPKTSLMTYALWGAGVFGVLMYYALWGAGVFVVVALGGGAYYFATRKSADEL